MFFTSSVLAADLKCPTVPKSIEVGFRLTFGGASSSSMYKTSR